MSDDTTTIYRVRHSQHEVGPWHAGNCLRGDDYRKLRDTMLLWAEASFDRMMEDTKEAHPVIRFDHYGMFTEEHVCGTDSIQKLRHWFCLRDAIIDGLFDAGFTVYKYVVPEELVTLSYSGLQVAFRPQDAIEIQELTLLVLLD